MTLRDPGAIEGELREVVQRTAELGSEYIDALVEEGRTRDEAMRAFLTLGAQLQTDIILGQ